MPGVVEMPGGRLRARRMLPLLLREGSSLLHQQCWLWGCDIRRDGGNLLLDYGFTRQRDPQAKRSTQYTHCAAGECCVRLWGSGVYFGDGDEGVFLNRFVFEPRLVRFEAGWQDPAELKRAPRFVDATRLCAACRWMAIYEDWVLERHGASYRRTCLASGPSPKTEVSMIAAGWRGLAAGLDRMRCA